MILRSIFLENFGLYGGRAEIDLVPRRRHGSMKPIVLIGGKNGAGKTTLLEAIRLALYGRRALGARVAQAEYDSYLRDRVHKARHGLEPSPSSASVGLEFDYAEGGVVHRYRVRRSWTTRGRTVVESLLLEKDGALIDDVPRDEWHHFLQELIPPGVSQLFFFDGEKIREIADGPEDDEQLAEAVRGLLGIELIGRLRTDLGLLIGRHQRADDGGLTERLEAVLRDISALGTRVMSLAEEVAQLTSTRESLSRVAEQARRRFVAEGGDLAARRTQLEAERHELDSQMARRQAELRDLANGLLPFAVAPRLARTFANTLRSASLAIGADRTNTTRELKVALQEWRNSNAPQRRALWRKAHWADVARFLHHWSSGNKDQPFVSALKEIGDRPLAIARLEEAERVTGPRAVVLAEELDALAARQCEVEAMLVRADNEAVSLLLDELRLAEQRVGATEALLKEREEELRQLRAQQKFLERERSRILEQQLAVGSAAKRAGLATRTAGALAEYERRLLESKIAHVRSEFVRCFNHLARKTDLVADIRINPATFSTTLIDEGGRAIPKTALSAGEKQVYAIAILWALARTSGRALPVVVDTPLARLDTDHRANLIERYFPSVSHQVIILSTDTEVDAALFGALGQRVSHAYQLEYLAAEGRTAVHAGYFSDVKREMEAPRALQQA